MRVLSTAVAAIAAGAAIASASPLRILVLSPAPSSPGGPGDGASLPPPPPLGAPFINMRLGHAVPPPPSANTDPSAPHIAHMMPVPVAMPHHGMHMGNGMNGMGGMKKPCGGRFRAKFNQKAIEVANSFRKAFGLPLIDTTSFPAIPHPHHGHSHGMIQITPAFAGNGGPTHVQHHGGPERGWKTLGGERVEVVTSSSSFVPGHHHMHHTMIGSSSSEAPFLERFTRALMSLGPWEGRAVAFVVGAGIGVLIRMVWVFCVLMIRGCKGERRDYYEEVAGEESDDDDEEPRRTPFSAPPEYVYPVDEKIVYAQEVGAPAKVDTPAPAAGN